MFLRTVETETLILFSQEYESGKGLHNKENDAYHEKIKTELAWRAADPANELAAQQARLDFQKKIGI